MDSISIRYGESVTLPLDAADVTAVTAAIFIGKPGQAYVLTQSISLTDGEGVFFFTGAETEIPLGTYYYQINVTGTVGEPAKYPSPSGDCDGCESEFPIFEVCEALDQIEVS